MDIWQVKNIKVKDLFPNKKNPRKISKENLKKLKSKIERLGFHNPVKVDEKMNLLGGNQRVKALLEMGAAELEIPVMIPNRPLTKKEKDEIIITDNISDGEWDWDLLKNEWNLDELNDWGLKWDLPDDEPEDVEIVEDELPEEIKTRCKRGDVWQLGNHRLMCGDSTVLEDIKKLMNGNKADIAFTDPPYGINVVNNLGQVGANFGVAQKGSYKKIIADETTDIAKSAFSILKKISSKQIIWGGNYFLDFLPISDSFLIWDKRCNSGIRNTFADGEIAWCSFHTPIRIYHQLWNGMIRE